MDKDAVRKRLEKRIKKSGSQRAFADEFSLSEAYVSDMKNGRRDFSERVLSILGLRIEYVEIRN